MFAKVFALFTISLFAAAAAAPGAYKPDSTAAAPQCSTGSATCCNSLQAANSEQGAALLGFLGIAAGSVVGNLGLGCVVGGQCQQQVACCDHVEQHSLIGISCNNIAL